jgi:GTP-binding protein Era
MNKLLQRFCGIVAIIGEPNAGKSTLVNRLVGGKVSIVSPKVQTTRFNVRGACAHEHTQLIFVDTPGIFNAEKQFEKAMVSAAWSGIGDADAVLLLLDAQRGLREETRRLIEKLRSFTSPLRGEVSDPALVAGVTGGGGIQKNPFPTAHPLPTTLHPHPNPPPSRGRAVYLAINKIDAVDKPTLISLAKACDEHGAFARIFMISALSGDGVDDVKKHLAGAMPPGPWLYPEDQMSDISLRLLAAEITREKIFYKLDQELPYAIFVETEAWEETDRLVKISQAIYVQREGQKKIVLGSGGEMIKAIGTGARKELEAMLDKKVHLALFVKVKPGWKEDSESYRLLGLEFKK